MLASRRMLGISAWNECAIEAPQKYARRNMNRGNDESEIKQVVR